MRCVAAKGVAAVARVAGTMAVAATGVAWVGTKRLLLAMLIALLGLGVGYGTAAGSSGVGNGTAVTAAALADTVVIKNFAFGPVSLVVTPGAKITVVNQDRAPHTLTARDKSFDTGTIAGGQRGEFTAPSSPGTYPYICTVHPYMAGTLIVK